MSIKTVMYTMQNKAIASMLSLGTMFKLNKTTMKNLILILLITLSYSSFSQQIWEAINLPDSTYPNTINAERENILLTSAKGMSGYNYIIMSENDGYTWEPLNFRVVYMDIIYSIRFSPSNALFVGTNSSIYRSLDNGLSFDEVYHNYYAAPSYKIEFAKNGDIYSIGQSIILRSCNNGTTWDSLYYSNSLKSFIDIDFGLEDEIYVVASNFYGDEKGFFRSINNGVTWENIGITNKQLQTVQVNSEGSILVSGPGVGGIYSSTDSGSSWLKISEQEVNNMESFSNDRLIACDNIDDTVGCWISNDWGNSWESLIDSIINPHVNQFSISPAGHVYCQSYPDYYNEYDYPLVKSAITLFNEENVDMSSSVRIYPNPTSDFINIATDKKLYNETCAIYSIGGQKVTSIQFKDNQINISKLNSGIYILELIFEDQRILKKIVIK